MAPVKAPAVKLKYTNRKSEGQKLAAIVAKDLRKHAAAFDKKKTTAENDSAQLELDLENKEQDDACVETFVSALQDALKERGDLTPLRLEELSLRNNNLTAAALQHLAPVIEAAQFDLHDVDISLNKVSVVTKKDAKAFAEFLRAFRGCEKMRRLDLSGNDFSGPLAMEVMLRVYCEQSPVDVDLLYYEDGPGGRDADYDMLTEVTNGMRITGRRRGQDEYSEDVTDWTNSLVNGKILKRRRGLRAIPYIILKDSKIDDAGALHLSYILERHHWPQYLMSKLKNGSKEAKRKEEDDAGGCFGMVFSDNLSMSPYGEKLLEYANAARGDLQENRASVQSPQGSWVDPIKVGSPSSTRSRKLSFQSDSSGDRRTSGAVTNILSLRKRLQRTTIETHGVQGVQLWHAAVKVLYAARVILPPSRDGQETTKAKLAAQMQVRQQMPGESAHSQTNGTNQSSKVQAKPLDRDTRNPKGFPTYLWVRIITEYAGGVDVLNKEQIGAIIEYARDRSKIKDEQHNQAKGESHQVWHVLEQLDCFTYEMK